MVGPMEAETLMTQMSYLVVLSVWMPLLASLDPNKSWNAAVPRTDRQTGSNPEWWHAFLITVGIYGPSLLRTGCGAVMHCDSCVLFRHYISCLFVWLTSFIPFSFFTSFLMFSFICIYFLVYFLTYQSTPSRIDVFHFQAGDCRRRPNLALVFWVHFVL